MHGRKVILKLCVNKYFISSISVLDVTRESNCSACVPVIVALINGYIHDFSSIVYCLFRREKNEKKKLPMLLIVARVINIVEKVNTIQQ